MLRDFGKQVHKVCLGGAASDSLHLFGGLGLRVLRVHVPGGRRAAGGLKILHNHGV